jgi:predicted membrane protein
LLFSWPAILLMVGLITGARHNFKNTGSIIMIVIGAIFLVDDIFPAVDISHFFFPLMLMGIGFWIIFGRKKKLESRRFRRQWADQNTAAYSTEWDARVNPENPGEPAADFTTAEEATTGSFGSNFRNVSGDDFIDTTSIFGSVNKTILSKDFKGGEIVNVFGGTELNFTQADISGRVYIDVTQLFGGIKLIVPPHWQVTSDIAAVFAGIDDKRRPGTVAQSPDKILILKGTSIFAGIEIRSY